MFKNQRDFLRKIPYPLTWDKYRRHSMSTRQKIIKSLLILVFILACNTLVLNIAKADIGNNSGADWIFWDDFEGSYNSSLTELYNDGWYWTSPSGTWFSVPPRSGVAIINTESYSDNQSIMMWFGNTTADDCRAFHTISPEQDIVYVRYYRKFPSNWVYCPDRPAHSSYIFGGNYTNPMDTDFTIYQDMNPGTHRPHLTFTSNRQKSSGELIVPEGRTYTSGYPAIPYNVSTPPAFDDGQWHEIQYMIKLNTVGQQDGELKFWVDGVLVSDQQNLVLRGSGFSYVKLNKLGIGFNNPGCGIPAQTQGNYFDALVVSTSYIDPVSFDSTPPSVPTNLSATTVSGTQIDLSWTASSDAESGIDHYNVYRDTAYIGQSSNTTYSDTGLSGNTQYSYEVTAVNGVGLESGKSTADSATTLGDTSPPTIVSVNAVSATTVKVEFNESVEQTSAETAGNYTLTGGVTVSTAELQVDGSKSVVITTSAQTEGNQYTLTVSGVKDASAAGNTMAQEQVQFTAGAISPVKDDALRRQEAVVPGWSCPMVSLAELLKLSRQKGVRVFDLHGNLSAPGALGMYLLQFADEEPRKIILAE